MKETWHKLSAELKLAIGVVTLIGMAWAGVNFVIHFHNLDASAHNLGALMRVDSLHTAQIGDMGHRMERWHDQDSARLSGIEEKIDRLLKRAERNGGR